MPFHFKMQKVLDYRAQLEEEARVRLATEQRRLQEAQERMQALQTDIIAAQERSRGNPLMESSERWLLEQYLKGLRADLATLALNVRMLAQLVEEARNLLAARSMEKKLLEKLKERQKIQYVHEEQLLEQRTNDETATLRYKAPSL